MSAVPEERSSRNPLTAATVDPQRFTGVNPDRFTDRMTHRWVQKFKNVPNPAGQAGWRIMAETYNRAIHENTRSPFDPPREPSWHVLRGMTGTGKTQGLALYASMLPRDLAEHPGVLIVTRLKVEATELAKTVNRICKSEHVAITHHGDHKLTRAEMERYPVLILTHRAYELGMDRVNRGLPEASSWESFNTWQGRTRALIVIDEALDIIKFHQATLETIKQVLAVIPEWLAVKFPDQMQTIRMLESVLRQIAQVAETRKGDVKKEPERVLWRGLERLPVDMTPLRRALKEIPLDKGPLGVVDPVHKRSRLTKLHDALEAIEATMDTWHWYTKKLREHTLNTARLIVPESIHSAVVLDGTANQNVIYKLFKRVKVVSLPDSREYPSVTLHHSTGHSLGKRFMRKHRQVLCRQLIANLQRTLKPLPGPSGTADDGTPVSQRRVFIATHKAVKPILLQHQATCGFGELAVESFGKIRGRNHWRDFDTVVVFGLPYTDSTIAPSTFFALLGIQPSQWFSDEKARAVAGYKDIRQALDHGRLVAEAIQALNRGRTRQPVTVSGDCEPTDLFILLPTGGLAQAILDGIKKEMPKIHITEWEYSEQRQAKRGAKSQYEASLVAHCEGLEAGKYSAREIQKYLGISNTQWDRLAGAMKNPESELHKRLVELHVSYLITREGKRNLAYIVKERTA